MTFEESIQLMLAARLSGVRVHKAPLERGPLPAVCWQRVGGTFGYSHSGPDGVYPVRVQLDCYAPTGAESAALADSVRTALNTFDLTLPLASPDEVLTGSPNKVLTQFSAPEPEPEPMTSREVIICMIWYRD